jgi:FAD/FMN-containing dehydrogenase
MRLKATTKRGKINTTITTTELKALWRSQQSPSRWRGKMRQSFSRRALLRAGLARGGSMLFSGAPLSAVAGQLDADQPDPVALKTDFGFKGSALSASDPGFETAAFGNLWNQLQPKRHPQIIAQATDEQDVSAAVKFARASKLKVAVRGGGHNWCSMSLRHNGLLIDLANLNRVLSIDPISQKAVVQPILSNRAIQAALNPIGMSFPSGHCPGVKASGYLLSGGMAWNHGVWGPGVGSVEAIEIVDATGKLITTSATENPDYFWAARGGGAGFFGIAVRYRLRLHPLPREITSSAYYYPYEQLAQIATWLDRLAVQLPSSVELSLFVIQAPPELADKARTSNGKVALVSAVIFADAADTATAVLSALDSFPAIDRCLSRSGPKRTNFEELFDGSGALWPPGLRCKVDALFFNAPLSDLCHAVKEHLLSAPRRSVFLLAAYTGENRPPGTPSDAAFSMTGQVYGGSWTQWESADDDAESISWHEKCVELLKPYVAGHYLGETDLVSHPEYARLSYAPAAWERLGELRRKYDPEGLFFGFDDGLR